MIGAVILDLIIFVPLLAYLVFLSHLHSREKTTVLSGRTDRLLLALGLSGIVVFGIGPTVIPLGSLDLYGVFALVLFFLLYLALVFYLDAAFSQRIIVYNLSESDFDSIPAVAIPEWNSAAGPVSEKNAEPAVPDAAAPETSAETKLRRVGGALVLPERGLTLSIEYTRRIRCAVLRVSGRRASPEDWKALQNEVRACFSGRPQPAMTFCTYLLMAVVCAVLGFLIAQIRLYL